MKPWKSGNACIRNSHIKSRLYLGWYMLDDRQDAKLFWLIISACFRHDWLTAMQVALADVIDVIDGRKLFNQLLLTNLRNCNYFTHLPPKSLIFHHPYNQNSFRNNNSAYLPLTLNQEDKFQTYFGTGDSFWDPLRNFLYKFTRIVLSVYKLNKLGKFW